MPFEIRASMRRWSAWFACAALAGAILAAHGLGLGNGFLNFDDPAMVVENHELLNGSWSSLPRVFTRLRNDAYLPIYELALHLDARIFGTEPFAFHFGSLLWHWLNASLVLLLARRIGLRGRSAFAAALLFALHPVTVESVAWVSGRKDQVSLALLLLASWLLLRYAALGRPRRLFGSGVLLAAAGLAKGSVVVAPALGVLLLWARRQEGEDLPRSRVRAGLAVWTGVAALLIGLHLSVAREAGTTVELVETGVGARIGLGLAALAHYVRHTLLPYPLAIHYHLIPSRLEILPVALGGALLLAALVVLGLRRRRLGVVGVGLAWWLTALAPFNNVVPRTAVALADRYLAIGLVGFALAVGGWIGSLRGVGRLVAVAGILGLGVLSALRTREFRDSETVFESVLRFDAQNPVAWSQLAEHALAQAAANAANSGPMIERADRNLRQAIATAERTGDLVQRLRADTRLADLDLRQGRFAEAEARFLRLEEEARALGGGVLRAGLDPVLLRHNRAQSVLGQGRDADGREILEQVLRERPGFGEAELTLALMDAGAGYALLQSDATAEEGRRLVDRAVGALELLAARQGVEEPVERRARYELVRILVQAAWRGDRLTAALRHERALARLAPRASESSLARALIAEEAGDPGAAIAALAEALERAPKDQKIRVRLSRSLRAAGENLRAVAILRDGIQSAADATILKEELADLLVAQGTHHLLMQDRARAAQAGAQALESAPKSAAARILLGEVAESLGKYPDAEAEFQRALELAPSAEQARLGLARCRQARGLGILADLKKRVEQAPDADREALEQHLRDQVHAEMRSAVELGGEAADVALARRWLQDREVERRRAAVSDLKERARLAGKSGQAELAEELLKSALRVSPDDPEVHLYLAQAYRDQTRYEEAQASAERALGLDPGSLAARKIAAEAAYIRGESAAAHLHAQAFLQEVAKRSETSGLDPAIEAMREIVRLTQR